MDLEFENVERGVCSRGAWYEGAGEQVVSRSPIDERELVRVAEVDRELYDETVESAREVFEEWSQVPAPRRGEVVRKLGNALRAHKEELGELIAIENGKTLEEGEGEVQEAIDMADFAVGQSRQLYGKQTKSERPRHRLYEQWHPLGVNAFITAFNFPVAVWAWNAMVSAVCGNTMIWKPSPKTPLCSIAVQKIVEEVFEEAGYPGVMNLAIGSGSECGTWMSEDERIPLVSATGSCRMGRDVSERVNARLGRTILELGGNNAAIVTPSAEMELAIRSIVFGAVGTAGQRCTTTRRLYAHESVAGEVVDRLIGAYEQVEIGDPLDESTLMGPLIDESAVRNMHQTLEDVREQGGEILYGGEVLEEGLYETGHWVEPCIVRARPEMPVVREETFAPILYVMEYSDFEAAVRNHNDVPHGLSSALYTTDLRKAEYFLSGRGSDCGIANVNAGTSGAEIGLAFGGEKETGGGREAGSDSWKNYMRRQTNTINWGDELPLSQGIDFDLE